MSHSKTKHTIDTVRQFAAGKGGSFLSSTYETIRQKYTWQCSNGHTWEARADHVIAGRSWCPHCAHIERAVPRMDKRKHTRADVIFALRDQELISETTDMVSVNDYVLVKCVCGYIRSMQVGKILKNGNYCRFCQYERHRKYSIADMRDIAHRNGGKCLSARYTSMHHKLQWECAHGHRWETEPAMIIYEKHWCSICNCPDPITIATINKELASHGVRCISRKYVNQYEPLLFVCKNAHLWQMCWQGIKYRKAKCLTCAGMRQRTLSDLRFVAKMRGGKCLSKKMPPYREKILWECAYGHRWEAVIDSVDRLNTWCPRCSGRIVLREDLVKIARERNGKLLSQTYMGAKVKHIWQCELGHIWMTTPNTIKGGCWCPECNTLRRRGEIPYLPLK